MRFIESGATYVDSEQVATELRRFVQEVVDRLDDAYVSSILQTEWRATLALDSEEIEFARAASKLGLDPFDVSEATAADLIAVSEDMDSALLDEFLDSVEPAGLRPAVHWLQQARQRVAEAQIGSAPVADLVPGTLDFERDAPPYLHGYELARAARDLLGVSRTDLAPIDRLVGRRTALGTSSGLAGYVGVDDSSRVGLVLPSEVSKTSERFAKARAIGLAATGPRHEYLLDPASTDSSKFARAFAAEFLAPAEGIAQYLSELRNPTEDAFEAIAGRYGVSPVLVRHQYENQLADS